MNPIDKIAWIPIRERKLLFVRSKGKDTFYTPGGKREEGESDEEALVREIKEELNVEIVATSLKYAKTFMAQAHGKPEGTFVEIKCYFGDYIGTLEPTSEIEEIAWFSTVDAERTTPTGKLILNWLKNNNLID